MLEATSRENPEIKKLGRQAIDLGLIDENDEGHYSCVGNRENGESAVSHFSVRTFERLISTRFLP